LGRNFTTNKTDCVFGVIIYKQYRNNISKTEAYNNHFSFVDEKCSSKLAVEVEEFEHGDGDGMGVG
jgi:hypothetical protein